MTLAAVVMLTLCADADEAQRLYEEGARHYQVEEYEAAIEAFKRSYVLSKNPGALYNLAQSYRFMGRCREAVRYYRLYLAEKPKAADRAAVEALIAKLGDCPDPQPTPEARATPPPESSLRPEPAPQPAPGPSLDAASAAAGPRWEPWLVTAVGGLVAASGVGLQVRQRLQFASLQQSCPCPEASWAAEPALERLSWGLLIGGAAVLLAGVFWLVLR